MNTAELTALLASVPQIEVSATLAAVLALATIADIDKDRVVIYFADEGEAKLFVEAIEKIKAMNLGK